MLLLRKESSQKARNCGGQADPIKTANHPSVVGLRVSWNMTPSVLKLGQSQANWVVRSPSCAQDSVAGSEERI